MSLTIDATPEALLTPGLEALLRSKYEALIDELAEHMKQRLRDEVEPYILRSVQSAMNYPKDKLDIHIKIVNPNTQ